MLQLCSSFGSGWIKDGSEEKNEQHSKDLKSFVAKAKTSIALCRAFPIDNEFIPVLNKYQTYISAVEDGRNDLLSSLLVELPLPCAKQLCGITQQNDRHGDAFAANLSRHLFQSDTKLISDKVEMLRNLSATARDTAHMLYAAKFLNGHNKRFEHKAFEAEMTEVLTTIAFRQGSSAGRSEASSGGVLRTLFG